MNDDQLFAYIDSCRDAVEKLPEPAQRYFAVLCVERMLATLRAAGGEQYSEVPRSFEARLDRIWHGKPITYDTVLGVLADLDPFTLEENMAQHVIGSFDGFMYHLARGETRHAQYVFVQALHLAEILEDDLGDSALTEEIQRQKADLATLQRPPSESVAAQLRVRARQTPIWPVSTARA